MSISVMKDGFQYDGRPWEQREFYPAVASDNWDVRENGYWATLSIWVGDNWGDYEHDTGRVHMICREIGTYLDENITRFTEFPLAEVDLETREVSDASMNEILGIADDLFSEYLLGRQGA